MTAQHRKKGEAGEHHGAARRLRDRGEHKVVAVIAQTWPAETGFFNPDRIDPWPQRWCKPARSHRGDGHLAENIAVDVGVGVWYPRSVPPAEETRRRGRVARQRDLR